MLHPRTAYCMRRVSQLVCTVRKGSTKNWNSVDRRRYRPFQTGYFEPSLMVYKYHVFFSSQTRNNIARFEIVNRWSHILTSHEQIIDLFVDKL
jgi:hypothetical protein